MNKARGKSVPAGCFAYLANKASQHRRVLAALAGRGGSPPRIRHLSSGVGLGGARRRRRRVIGSSTVNQAPSAYRQVDCFRRAGRGRRATGAPRPDAGLRRKVKVAGAAGRASVRQCRRWQLGRGSAVGNRGNTRRRRPTRNCRVPRCRASAKFRAEIMWSAVGRARLVFCSLLLYPRHRDCAFSRMSMAP